jgi:hypothetical protein
MGYWGAVRQYSLAFRPQMRAKKFSLILICIRELSQEDF